MTNRERVRNSLNFKPVDRLPMIEWASWWDLTINRWKAEGLPDLSHSEYYRYLGLDEHRQFWLPTKNDQCPAPSSYGAGLIENEDDYSKIKEYLYPHDAVKRLAEHLKSLKPRHENGEFSLWITLSGFFWFPRELFGIENHLYSFYDNPRLYHRICSDLASFHIKCIEQFCEFMVPDFMTFGEDMSYNHGPMISKELFDKFLLPYYQRVIPYLKQSGIKVLIDSDGNITEMVPWLIKAGIEGALPLERQACVDIFCLQDAYPDFVLVGGFDKTVMKYGENAMRAEFERLLPAMSKGGYIPSVDHQTPPEVSLENYRIYVRLLSEYCKLTS